MPMSKLAILAEQSYLGITQDALIFVGVQLGEVMPADPDVLSSFILSCYNSTSYDSMIIMKKMPSFSKALATGSVAVSISGFFIMIRLPCIHEEGLLIFQMLWWIRRLRFLIHPTIFGYQT